MADEGVRDGGDHLLGQARGWAITAADELGDAELTARVIGARDVPAIWTRADDPEQAARPAREAGQIARRLDDPALLAFALNGVFMQTWTSPGPTGTQPPRTASPSVTNCRS